MGTVADDVTKLGTILSVWAHPDDESFSAAGILTTAVDNGQTVVCLTATKGEEGSQDIKKWPPTKLADIRAKELKEALKELGIKNHYWLGYRDGSCADVPDDEAARNIAKYIKKYEPDTILTFGPDGMTGHPDHQSVSRWAGSAARMAKSHARILHSVVTKAEYNSYLKRMDEKLDIFFNIDKPLVLDSKDCTFCYDLPQEICARKCRALKKMPSQIETMEKLFGDDYMQKAFCMEAFVVASK